MISRLAFDALSALTLAVTALLGAYIPVFLARQDRKTGGTGRSLTFVLGNLFSAGVMVSAGFCHLLGESLRQMPESGRFPLPTFLCGVGFMLTLVADAVASSASSGGAGGAAGGDRHGADGGALGGCCGTAALAAVVDPEKALTPPPPPVPGLKSLYKDSFSLEGERLIPNGRYPSDHPAAAADRSGEDGVALCVLSSAHHYLSENQLTRHHHSSNGGLHSRGASAGGGGSGHGLLGYGMGGGSGGGGADPDLRFTLEDGGGGHEAAAEGGCCSSGACGSGDGGGGTPLDGGRGSGVVAYAVSALSVPPGGSHRPGLDEAEEGAEGGRGLALDGVGAASPAPSEAALLGLHSTPRTRRGGHGGNHGAAVSFITAVLMGVALCFHSLLEGAAMGAQETLTNSLHIFIAIVSHKGLAAYALGSSIVDSHVSMQQFWSVVLPFTFASPVGIFIGYVISDLATGAGAAAISALASGTFLYVAFMEVIPKEMRDRSHVVPKLAMLLLGFGAMSLLAVWA